jgi:hypothetical protein
MNFKRRVGRLEDAFRIHAPQRIRMIIIRLGESGGLQRCTRSLHRGILTEIVRIAGSRDNISEDEIERFIESHPIGGATNSEHG